MYCDDDFIYCKSNGVFNETGIGRFLFYKDKSNERLYIHIRNKRETSFYCRYKQIVKNNVYLHEYEEIELKTEKEIMDYLAQSDKSYIENIFEKLRTGDMPTFVGWKDCEKWKEWKSNVLYDEEKQFLRMLDNK